MSKVKDALIQAAKAVAYFLIFCAVFIGLGTLLKEWMRLTACKKAKH